MPRINELTGKTFGRLQAQWPVGRNRYGSVMWLCLCDCGKLKLLASQTLVTGATKSCGCLLSETTRRRMLKHGGSGTPEYEAYKEAKKRCTNPKQQYYVHYGGRGIKFLFRDFTEFLGCVGRRPSRRHSLDRIDNDGHYAPGNVRWATDTEQAANRRPHRRMLQQFSTAELLAELKRRGA